MTAMHGYVPPPFVRDQEGLIHKIGAVIERISPDDALRALFWVCPAIHGQIVDVDADSLTDSDMCCLCWPPKPAADVAADRSESA